MTGCDRPWPRKAILSLAFYMQPELSIAFGRLGYIPAFGSRNCAAAALGVHIVLRGSGAVVGSCGLWFVVPRLDCPSFGRHWIASDCFGRLHPVLEGEEGLDRWVKLVRKINRICRLQRIVAFVGLHLRENVFKDTKKKLKWWKPQMARWRRNSWSIRSHNFSKEPKKANRANSS